MDVDVARQRRNVIVISVALILYKALDAELGTVKVWGEGVVVSGENIIWIALFVLPYMVWRYWLYVKDEHSVIKDKAYRYLRGSDLIKDSFRRLKMGFIKDNQIIDWELYWEGVSRDLCKVNIAHERHDVGWDGGEIISSYSGHNDFEEFKVKYASERLGVWNSLLCICSCYLKVILGEKEFSDLYIPYVTASIAFGWTVLGML